MAMTIRLQDEFGKVIDEVHDTKGTLVSRLPLLSDNSSHCLRFIDPYGDTYFNRMQMETLLAEWERLFGGLKEKEDQKLFMRVRTLAQQCQQEPHLYLKFVGD